MTRIFTVLASVAVIWMLIVLMLGLSMGDLRHDPTTATKQWATMHRLGGVAAALGVVLVNSIVVTYFIGTSRWCREVVETYGLDFSLIARGNAIKRRAFPWAVSAMLTVVGIIALGGAADPGTGARHSADWVTPHLLGAIAGVCFVALASYFEYRQIEANHLLIEQVLDEVRQIRRDRGLDV